MNKINEYIQSRAKEFEKESYFYKDKVDGQEHCLAGDNQFYLTKANDDIKSFTHETITQLLEVVKEMVEELHKDHSQCPIPESCIGYQNCQDDIHHFLNEANK